MRKKILVLAIIYLAALIPGTWFQLQQGVFLNDQLWRQTDEDRIELSQDSYLTFDGDTFELSLNGRVRSGQRTILNEEETLFTFSDGWSLRCPASPFNFAFSAGSYYGGGEGTLRIDDMEKMGLKFLPEEQTERHAIYDSNGYIVGESVHVIAADGVTILSYTEEWFDQPEFSWPQKETIVVQNGSELEVASAERYVILNEAGEYLVNQDNLYYMQLNGIYMNKANLCAFIDRAMNGEITQRGSLGTVLLSAVVYVLGAAFFLYPRWFALFGERWKYSTEIEPSDAYIFCQSLGGVILMGLAIMLLFFIG